MDNDISQKFAEQAEKLDRIYSSTERMRKYFLWTLIISVVFIILPLLGIALILPNYVQTLLSAGAGF